VLDLAHLEGRVVEPEQGARAIVLVEVTDAGGRKVRLQDFATVAEGGARYVSWLGVKGGSPAPFSEANPLRSTRVAGD
jgi:hypothetical protein